MANTVNTFKISNNVELINRSAIGWFYEKGQSIEMLVNKNPYTSNTLAIVVPNENFHFSIKLTGSNTKSKSALLKLYAKYCEKFNVENIFAN